MLAGIKEIREVMADAERLRRATGQRTIVFIDEIHRFNKAQQDAFLPRVEAGDIVLIGATTENPSFEVNAALLSRSKVFVMRGLTTDEVERHRLRAPCAIRNAASAANRCAVEDAALKAIAVYANGDARVGAEPARAQRRRRAARRRRTAARPRPNRADDPAARAALRQVRRGALQHHLGAPQVDAQQRPRRGGLLAGAHGGSRRGSAATSRGAWCAFASEDIGNADPQALTVAVAAKDAVHFIGMPEGNTALAQAAIYLGDRPEEQRGLRGLQPRAPKTRTATSPNRCRCTCGTRPRSLMKDLDYGKGYRYAHNEADAVGGHVLPAAGLEGRNTTSRRSAGSRKEIKRRLDGRDEIRSAAASDPRQPPSRQKRRDADAEQLRVRPHRPCRHDVHEQDPHPEESARRARRSRALRSPCLPTRPTRPSSSPDLDPLRSGRSSRSRAWSAAA